MALLIFNILLQSGLDKSVCLSYVIILKRCFNALLLSNWFSIVIPGSFWTTCIPCRSTGFLSSSLSILG